MAFKPPDNFDFSTPEQWPAWRQRFLRYRTASELSKKTVDVQTSVLIYSMGPTAEEIFNMFDVEEEGTTFDEIIDLFNGYFTPKVNVIRERAVFHQRSQLAGENIYVARRKQYHRLLLSHGGETIGSRGRARVQALRCHLERKAAGNSSLSSGCVREKQSVI